MGFYHRADAGWRSQLHGDFDDAAGNIGATSAALSVTIDMIAPVAPTISSFSTDSGVAGDGLTNDNTLTLTGTAEADASTSKSMTGRRCSAVRSPAGRAHGATPPRRSRMEATA